MKFPCWHWKMRMIWRSASLSSTSSLLFVSLTVSDLLLSLQTLYSLLAVDQSRLSDILLMTYMVASLCFSLSIPADKTISLACPFQYHNIVTRSAHQDYFCFIFWQGHPTGISSLYSLRYKRKNIFVWALSSKCYLNGVTLSGS